MINANYGFDDENVNSSFSKRTRVYVSIKSDVVQTMKSIVDYATLDAFVAYQAWTLLD